MSALTEIEQKPGGPGSKAIKFEIHLITIPCAVSPWEREH